MNQIYARSVWYVSALDTSRAEYGLAYDDDIAVRRLSSLLDPAANAWSSMAVYTETGVFPDTETGVFPDDEIHLPCFDVDKPLMAHEKLKLDRMFPGYVTYPSSTPGHCHVYSDTPLDGKTYFGYLQDLADFDIVEQGYVNASRARGSTFLRLPHIRKKVMP